MSVNHLYKDPITAPAELRPGIMPVVIDSGGQSMHGVVYTAAGKGPNPTMILLHGFPGTEQNLDLAHAFRRAGWNTVVFHYRGSWGSDGCFSFHNVLEDVKAALKFVRSEQVSRECRIDRENIVLFGHSMGGFAALLSTMDDPQIRACIAAAPFDFGAAGAMAKENKEVRAHMQEMIRECIVPLKRTSVELLLGEMMDGAQTWSFVRNAEKLSRCRVLLIGGERDEGADPRDHYYPLIHALAPYKPDCFEYHLLDSDHSFQNKRVELSEIIQRWLEKQG